jgi:hypothetical protein
MVLLATSGFLLDASRDDMAIIDSKDKERKFLIAILAFFGLIISLNAIAMQVSELTKIPTRVGNKKRDRKHSEFKLKDFSDEELKAQTGDMYCYI